MSSNIVKTLMFETHDEHYKKNILLILVGQMMGLLTLVSPPGTACYVFTDFQQYK